MKHIRTIVGSLLCIIGVVLTIIPGSSLVILAGLVLISMDYPAVRTWLGHVQKSTARAARKVDKWILQRKLR